MLLAALNDGWFYALVVLVVLVGFFLVGLALGLGIWVGHGLLEARSDRQRDRAWQEWQEKATTAETARKDQHEDQG